MNKERVFDMNKEEDVARLALETVSIFDIMSFNNALDSFKYALDDLIDLSRLTYRDKVFLFEDKIPDYDFILEVEGYEFFRKSRIYITIKKIFELRDDWYYGGENAREETVEEEICELAKFLYHLIADFQNSLKKIAVEYGKDEYFI